MPATDQMILDGRTLESDYCSPQTVRIGRGWRIHREKEGHDSRSATADAWHLSDVVIRPHPTVSGKWLARGKYRNADGKRFDATASGDSEAKAKRALQAKVEQHRQSHRGGDATLNQDTTVDRAARLWLEAA